MSGFNPFTARERDAVEIAEAVVAGAYPADMLSEVAAHVLAAALLRERDRAHDYRFAFMDPSILCANGEYFEFLAPEDFSWDPTVLAAGCRAPRFTGQTRTPGTYSINQHEVLGAEELLVRGASPSVAFEFLMHDSHEGIYGDMATPFKILLPDYKEHEDRGEAAMRARYFLPAKMTSAVKAMDLIMLGTEKRDIMPNPEDEWAMLRDVEPLASPIVVWDVEYARDRWLKLFNILWPQHEALVLAAA